MADHLHLADPRVLSSKRRKNNRDPDAGPLEPNRPKHARTLAGILAGIEGQIAGASEVEASLDVDEEYEADDRPPVVLVVTGRAQLKDGPFGKWGLKVLSEVSGNTYIVLSSAEARAFFAELVGEYGRPTGEWTRFESWRDQLDAIEGVRLYGAEDRADVDLAELTFESIELVDVLLWASMAERPSRRARTARQRVADVEGYVASAVERDPLIGVVAVDDRPDTTMLRIRADRALLNRPGFRGGSRPTEDESHGCTEEVPGRASGAGDPARAGCEEGPGDAACGDAADR